jgi:osmotically-inducible protein OsmY
MRKQAQLSCFRTTQDNAGQGDQGPMKRALSNDDALQRAVLLELNAADVPAGRAAVAVDAGIVTLLGYVEHAAQKRAAESAALRVEGVKAVVVAIEVRGVDSEIQHDDQLAVEVLRRLAWDVWVPKDVLKVKIEHGHVTLLGQLDRDEQRSAALEDVTRLFGVTGVSDQTTVKSAGKTADNGSKGAKSGKSNKSGGRRPAG